MLTVHRPANTTESALSVAGISEHFTAHPPPFPGTRQQSPVSQCRPLPVFPVIRSHQRKILFIPDIKEKRKKKNLDRLPSLHCHTSNSRERVVHICFVFYEENSCHVWTRRPVGCCKNRHAEVLKSDTSVDSSSSRRRRLVCRDCGREGRQTVCDHQRCWLPKFDVFHAPQTQKKWSPNFLF